jgi:hypothetical protein
MIRSKTQVRSARQTVAALAILLWISMSSAPSAHAQSVGAACSVASGSLTMMNGQVLVCNGSNWVLSHTISTSGAVGIGTTTPYDALDLASTDQYANMRVIQNVHSSADGNMYIGYNNAAGSYLYLYGQGTTPQMMVEGSNGYVGIGTTSPGQKLTVEGNLLLGGTANAAIYTDTRDINNNSAVYFFGAGTNSGDIISTGTGATSQGMVTALYGGSWGSTNIQMLHNGTNGVITTGAGNIIFTPATGNVGIGTTSPNALLTVRSNSEGTENLISLFNNAGTDYLLGVANVADGQSFYLNGNSGRQITVTAGGNVGIGTTSPSTTLAVNGNAYFNGTTEYLGGNPTGSYIGAITSGVVNPAPAIMLVDHTNNYTWELVNGWSAAGDFQINKGGTGPMLTITSGGNVGIGTTGPDKLLEVNGVSHLGNDVYLTRTDGFATASLVVDNSTTTGIALQKAAGGTIGNIVLNASNVNVPSGSLGVGTSSPGYTLDVNGNIHLAGTLYTPGSSSNYGSVTIDGSKNGWSGINFKQSGTNQKTLMINTSVSGIYNSADNTWDWYWTNGTLTTGTVPAANVSGGTLSGNYTFGSSLVVDGNITANGGYLYTSDGSNGLVQSSNGNLYLRPVNGSAVVVMDTGTVTVSGNLTASSNIYWGTGGNWLSAYLNQAVLTSSSPSFNNVTINGVGTIWGTITNQALTTGNAPTFAGETLNGTLTVNGNIDNNGALLQVNGGYVYPGRNDGGGNYQTSWYLASNGTYGLMTNTNLYAGNFYVAGVGWLWGNITNQGLTTGAAPTFAGETLNGTLTVNANINSNGQIQQVQGGYIWPGRNDGGGNYQGSWYLGSSGSWGLYTNTSMYFQGSIFQGYGAYIWPGRNDGSNANGQQSWYLASNGSYGLYTNTGMYFAGNLYVGSGQVATNGDVYMSWAGVWASQWVNQNLTTGAGPTFGNLYINCCGIGWLSNILNQSVTTGATPTFANVEVSSNLYLGYEGNWISTMLNTGCITVNWSGYCGYQMNINGNSYTTGNTWSSNYYHDSDIRLKMDIKPVKGLDIIEKLSGVQFRWKKDGTLSAGVIAQDVEKVMPEAVSADHQGIKAVSYDALIAPLIESVKELKAENDNDATAIAVLKAQNATATAAISALHADNDNLRARLDALERAQAR